MAVQLDVSGSSSPSTRGTVEIAENVAIAVLGAASMWALGSAMLGPALIAIAVLTPIALLITLRHVRG
jgi:hypothetical protein